MSWLRGMLGKPGSEWPVSSSEHPAPAPDASRLRQSIAAAATAEERAQRERELGRACAEQGQPPLPDDAPAVWTEAVCGSGDKTAATQWVGRLEGDASLAEAVMRSRFAEVRIAAARRISDLAVLKRLADAVREKDKQVYRRCTEVLRAHRRGLERTRRAAALVVALRSLLGARPVAVSRLLQIEKEFASLGEGTEELSECAGLIAQAQGCVLEETRAQIALRARLVAAEALRSEIAACESTPAGRLDAWQQRLKQLERETADAPQWLVKIPAGRELAPALNRIESRLSALAAALDRAAVCEPAIESPPAVEQPLPKAPKPPKPKLDYAGLQRSLDELERHLEEGRLADADAVSQRAVQAIGDCALNGPLAQRWQRAQAQLTRLHGWARWGTDQAREQLIAKAETLLGGEADVDACARAVPAMHKEWKRLDAHGPAAKALWLRFNAALEKAYRPVLEHRAAEAKRQRAARAEKAARCDAWEAWFEQFASAPPDYRALAAKRDELSAQWRAGAIAGFRDERQLRKRMDALRKRMDALLDEARTKEIARREELLAEAEALRDVAEIARAVSEARSLQARWKDDAAQVRLRHGTEQKLWERFRTACNAVFAHRDALRAEQAARRDEREQARRSGQEARDLKRSAEREIESQRKAKHAARFERMAQKAAGAEPAGAEALAQGHAARAALLIDLEIALELPTPEMHATARRARALSRLQDRFRGGGPGLKDPEAMVAEWYALAAAPDDEQAMRMAAIVRRLLD